MPKTVTRPKYLGVPASVTKDDPSTTLFNGKPGSPFVAEISHIEQLVEECRTGIGRYLNTWENVRLAAMDADDDRVTERATNELHGLYSLLNRLRRAVM